MNARRQIPRERALEVLLWGLALLAGGFVFLPAALDLVQGQQLEAEERARLQTAEERLRATDRQAQWLLLDPEADGKLYEQMFHKPYNPEDHPQPSAKQ